jgi:hypothetical protein
VPLGYRVADRQLKSEAAIVRLAFRRYLALGSMLACKVRNKCKNVALLGGEVA